MPSSSGRAMMLAKLSGRPSTTQLPIVSKPARTSGARVIITSAARRNTSGQQHQDGDEGQDAGLDKGADDGAAGFADRNGRAGGVGRDLQHRIAEGRKRARDRCWCPWEDLNPRGSVGGDPFRSHGGGHGGERHTAGVSASDNCRSMVLRPGTMASAARARFAAGPFASASKRVGQARAHGTPARLSWVPAASRNLAARAREAGHGFARRWARASRQRD